MKISRIDVVGQNGNDAAIYHHLHKHGHRPKKGSSPTYNTWRCMLARCEDPNYDNYPMYGANGIKVCERWQDFINFLADMGERPAGCTIDRIDREKGYEPGNCRWATPREQALNRRNVTFAEVRGEHLCLMDISRKYGIPMSTLFRRYSEGLRGEALIAQVNRNKYRRGPRSPSSKLTEGDVKEIKCALMNGAKNVDLARRFGVSASVISDIKRGATWTHVIVQEGEIQ